MIAANSLRDMPQAPAVFVSADVCDVITHDVAQTIVACAGVAE
jgi:hypothetical protein